MQKDANPMIKPTADSIRQWAAKFDVTPDQIHAAIKAVGTDPAEVEAYLKGTKATTNAERTRAAP